MNDTNAVVDLTACDVEPIHIPGSIQPHGLLLVADWATLELLGVAGDIEGRLGPDWLARNWRASFPRHIDVITNQNPTAASVALGIVNGVSETFEATAHHSDTRLIIEFEPAEQEASSTSRMLEQLDENSSGFERCYSLRELYQSAAKAFRQLTGFDRVLVYQFLDDDTGVVVAEDKGDGLGTFLNHHFPASDIPKQARALYIRNRVRIIPDVSYQAAPIRSSGTELANLDLSDVTLRSVSPVHIQYLKNMRVQASASISIVRDGLLWGMIACHNLSPKHLSLSTRTACRALAGGLARQIRAKDEAETYRERIRLRASEDAIVRKMATTDNFNRVFADYSGDLCEMLGADGFIASIDGQFFSSGNVPESSEIPTLLQWAAIQSSNKPFATAELGKHFPSSASLHQLASGILAITVPADTLILLAWFRPEEVQIVNWAGNPHKDSALGPDEILTPRASFENWTEEVRGRSRRWTLNEIEAARRLSQAVLEVVQQRRIGALNRTLADALKQKENLLVQKDFLMREIDHRVQNSLQMVSSFLGMQARMIDDQTTVNHINEARSRLAAVALVHRRLYADGHAQTVDLSRYLSELKYEIVSSIDKEWDHQITVDLSPILIAADRAVSIGLVFAELIMNANKYAYGGKAGPISIVLEQHRGRFRLIVADKGSGKKGPGSGFGTKMLRAVVASLGGKIEETDDRPGLRVIVTAAIVKQ